MHLLWTPLWLQNAFIYLSMESFFVKNDSRCNLSYIPLKWYLTRMMSTALLVLTLLSGPLKALKNCCTIIDYFEAKDVKIIIKNSLFQFFTRNQSRFFVRTFTMMALSTILGQIMKFCWSGQHEWSYQLIVIL